MGQLPHAWNIPPDAQIRNLLARLNGIADRRRKPADDHEIEGAILVLLILQTGRMPAELIDVMITADHPGELREGNRPGQIVLTRDRILIHSPVDEAEPGYREPEQWIALPQSRLLGRLIERLPEHCDGEGRLFRAHHGALEKKAKRIIRANCAAHVQSVKASRTLPALARWLRYRMRDAGLGDPGVHAIFAAAPKGSEEALAHYLSLNAAMVWETYCCAISTFLGPMPECPPELRENRFYGRGRCPDDSRLRVAIGHLRAALRCWHGPDVDCEPESPLGCTRRHLAMMLYTYAFATFGTGQRSIGHICAIDQIDTQTGFAWVVEKSNPAMHMSGERGVFHPQQVLQQLTVYECYCDKLEKKLRRKRSDLAGQLENLRKEDGLAFFRVERDRIVRLTPHTLCTHGKAAFDWPYDEKAGRRWLRSYLTGRVPSDALAAQFGHRLDGFDCWGEFSGLDPGAVARCLSKEVDRQLARVGFQVDGSRTKRIKIPQSWTPDFSEPVRVQADRIPLAERKGRILASAIWNGALLNTAFEQPLIDKVGDHEVPVSIEIDDHGFEGCQRWIIDPQTFALLSEYPFRNWRLPESPDELLRAFLPRDLQVSEFRDRASMRWRFRLPPVLHDRAGGKCDNRCLSNDRMGLNERKNRRNPTFARRRTCAPRDVPRELKEYFRTQEELLKQTRKMPGDPRTPKEEARKNLIDNLQSQSFIKRMSRLEISLVEMLIDQLTADRGHDTPCGYSLSTINRRIDNIWRDFIPAASEAFKPWESREIQSFTADELEELAAANLRDRTNVLNDIAALLPKKLYHTGPGVREKLLARPENRTADVLRAMEYQTVTEKTAPESAALYALCFRAGIRTSELSHIRHVDLVDLQTDRPILLLDHRPDRRAKTFHSRRRIPLNPLLTAEEIASVRTHFTNLRYADADQTDQSVKLMERELRKATGWRWMSAYPMRHSFATNMLGAFLLPEESTARFAMHFDPLLMERAPTLKREIVGKDSLGALSLYALAEMMGHTSPRRTLYSYAHNLELLVAAHVERHLPRQSAPQRGQSPLAS